MNTSLHYEQIEINENKCRYSFEEENELESLEKLVSEHLPKDYSFTLKDIIIQAEKSEINYFKARIENLDIKEKILLTAINEIKEGIENDELQYIEFDNNKDIKNENNHIIISNKIFKAIDKMVHKTLHKKRMMNGKEIKECIFYDDFKPLSEFGENIKYIDLDKLICNLKEGNKYFEFITIKSIMISITNVITEYIKKYLSLNENSFNNKINEENKEDKKNEFDLEKLDNFNIIEANIFEDIYNDFVTQSNLSSELENNFIFSLDSFRDKFQMNFTLSELFTDIFWNNIFHNKKLCILFIKSYLNEEIYGDIKIYLKKILKIIMSVNIPLKHQIVELLGLNQLENYEKNDLMTLIVSQKNIHHNEIIKLEIEKENLNKINNNKKIEDEKKNINKNSEKNNLINNNMKNVENIKYNIITANDISTIKNKTQPLLSVCNNNNMILNKDNNNKKEKEKENKEKDIKKDENYLNKKSKEKFLDDMEHKTVDEIFNYINDDKIVKIKKKKKSRKNKKNKKEEDIEDSIVIKFKEDLNDTFIHASTITKIKPIISENWIKAISNKD